MDIRHHLIEANKELLKRTAPYRVIDALYDCQRKVANSLSKRIAILTSRRAGKSWTLLSIQVSICLSKPNARCLYLALTSDQSRSIALLTISKILLLHGIRVNINRTELTITFENGSVIRLAGADDQRKIQRFRGGWFDHVVVDEAGSFPWTVLEELIKEVIEPALADTEGTLVLAGTPWLVQEGPFFDATQGLRPEWEPHTWSTFDNESMAAKWEALINKKREINPSIFDEPGFQREFLGKWAKDITEQVYRYTAELNDIYELPELDRYVLGVDLGWNDPCAFVLTGSAPHDHTFYVLESYEQSGMLPHQIAERLKHYIDNYAPLTIVADTSHKTVVQELEYRYGISIINAEKTNKADWIETMNSDFLLARIKIVPGPNTKLIKDYDKLVWKTKSDGTRIEDQSLDNHLCDGDLYAYRFSWPYLNKPKPAEPTIEEQMWKEAQRQASAKRRPYWK